jgi:predicted RNase H-like HicB family nuclease
MSSRAKLSVAIRNNPKDVRFSDACKVARWLDFNRKGGKVTDIARRYPASVFWSDEDAGFIAIAPDLPGCSAIGETRSDALLELEQAISAWIEAAMRRAIRFQNRRGHRWKRSRDDGSAASMVDGCHCLRYCLGDCIVSFLKPRGC